MRKDKDSSWEGILLLRKKEKLENLLAPVTELQNTGIDPATWETMETRKLDALRTPII